MHSKQTYYKFKYIFQDIQFAKEYFYVYINANHVYTEDTEKTHIILISGLYVVYVVALVVCFDMV